MDSPGQGHRFMHWPRLTRGRDGLEVQRRYPQQLTFYTIAAAALERLSIDYDTGAREQPQRPRADAVLLTSGIGNRIRSTVTESCTGKAVSARPSGEFRRSGPRA